MSVAAGQQQTFLRLLRALRPYWRRDPALPARIQALLARHREFGSRDRRLYRELLYTTLRYLPWVEPVLDTEPARAAKIAAWLAAETRDTHAYRAELAGDWPAAATLEQRAALLEADAQALLPGWFRTERPELFAAPELDAQLARAPLWLRIQTDNPAEVATEFEAQGWAWKAAPALPSAWRLAGEIDVTKTQAFARGAIEVQDLGSQFVLESVGITAGQHWLDACAGAGGKTLQLARLLGPAGRVDAQDIRAAALQELRTRVSRARFANVTTVTTPAPGGYDGVVVDAPCSGSGTWRRSPHLKWVTTPETVAERAALQLTLLRQYAAVVKPGGRLVYATCSLASRENEGVVAAFLDRHPGFSIARFARTFGFTPTREGLTVLPARHDTDGFFVASLQRSG